MINEKYAKMYCSEDISKIENYDLAVNDKTQTWDCHHRLEVQGQFRNSTALLKKCGMYFYVPASQLIFLTPEDHHRIHNLGKHNSVETRKKLSAGKIGMKFWNNGVKCVCSKECPGQGWVRGRIKFLRKTK